MDGTMTMTYLTEESSNRPIGMGGRKLLNWKRLAAVAALFCAAASIPVVANPCVTRPVTRFIQFYEQGQDLDLWQRVLLSLLMTKSSS